MPKQRLEAHLLAPVSNYLRRHAYGRQQVEVPFYDYRIDLYGYSRRLDSSVAVELKLTKWRRALQQAVVYQLCADRVYVALPQQVVTRVDTGLFDEHGIGLIAVSNVWRCSVLIQAQQSLVTKLDYRMRMVDSVLGSAA